MKTDKNILVAFLLNVTFSVIEFIGGIFTNSVAIMSDSIHDLGDAVSIGVSYFLERMSKRKPNQEYTFGYLRYSVLGAFITTMILTLGSGLVIISSISRILNPVDINYNGMIIFAIFGTIINFLAAYFTREGDSLNQKAVNLHMLEDVLGWLVVLIGSIVMRFTDISMLDSIMSLGVAVFILFNCIRNLKEVLDLFLEKTPSNISIEELKHHILEIKGVKGVHHIHIWSMNEANVFATMHIISDEKNVNKLKDAVREEMCEHGVTHVTIEIEDSNSKCEDEECHVEVSTAKGHTHHH